MTLTNAYGPAGIYGGREEAWRMEGKMDGEAQEEALKRYPEGESAHYAYFRNETDYKNNVCRAAFIEGHNFAAHRLQAALEATERKLREAEADATEQHAALDRVWKALGFPPKGYKDAHGKDVGELVADLTAALAAARGIASLAKFYQAHPDDAQAFVSVGSIRALAAALPSPTSEKAEG